MSDQKTPFWETDLYKLLNASFPKIRTERGDRFDVYRFADMIDVSAETVYKWLRSDRLTPRGASRIVGASDSRIKPEDVSRFVIPVGQK